MKPSSNGLPSLGTAHLVPVFLAIIGPFFVLVAAKDRDDPEGLLLQSSKVGLSEAVMTGLLAVPIAFRLIGVPPMIEEDSDDICRMSTRSLLGTDLVLPEGEVPGAITDADRVDVFPSGFKVRGADDKGLCIDSSSPASSNIESFDYFDPVLEFNQDLVYTCQAAKMDTLTSRECNDFDFSSHLIFTHLEQELQAFGSFGSANPHKIGDWKKVVAVQTEDGQDGEAEFSANLGTAAWQDDSRLDKPDDKLCKVYSNVSYTIYYSEMGYQENPQQYIVKIEKRTTAEEWSVLESADQQTFHLSAAFQFVRIPGGEADKTDFISQSVALFKRDMFYPFLLHSNSHAVQTVVAAALTLTSVLALAL